MNPGCFKISHRIPAPVGSATGKGRKTQEMRIRTRAPQRLRMRRNARRKKRMRRTKRESR